MEAQPAGVAAKPVIVFTDVKTLRLAVDVSVLDPFGEVRVFDALEDEELKTHLRDADIVVTNRNRINRETVGDDPHFSLVCEAGTGFDNIDLEFCRTHGIAVTNVPGYAGESVAQHTFSMLFFLLSHSKYYDEYVRSGAFFNGVRRDTESYSNREFFELAGKTWGIVGLGDIGARVAQLATCFGCRVCYTSVRGTAKNSPYEYLPLDELLEESDIVSIHLALSPLTKDLIGANELARMKPSAILLNLGRGGIVDEAALAEALGQGTIAAAGLDVLAQEPIPPDHPLLRLPEPDRIYITPHIAFGSREARQRLMEGVAANIRSFLEGGTANRVDL